MGKAAAKQGDLVQAQDKHWIQPPSTSPPVLTPHPFTGIVDGGVSSTVLVMGMPGATVNSTATNTPPHVPIGGTFVSPPANRATVVAGSSTVLINGRPAARDGDRAVTCDESGAGPVGQVKAKGTVLVG